MSRVSIITLRVLFITLLAWAAEREAAAQNSALVPRYNVANQHTYVLSPAGLTWQTARSYSRTLGGHLVAINNAAEQAFIHGQYGALGPLVYWIGLTDEASEGVFAWDSEEPVTFTGFCPGEPNDFANDEDYVEIAFTATGPCWNDDSSPNLNGSSPTQGIIELAHGDRVNFDTSSSACDSGTFPTPLGATTHPEGISWNGANFGRHPFVTTIVEDGMPVTGTKYFRLPANGVLTMPLGVAPLRPLPATVNEVRVLIPPGATGVSLAWELVAREALNSTWNDGMDISVVDAAGFLIARVVNADMASPQEASMSTGAYCIEPGGKHLLPAGPQGASAALPPLPHPAYLSIACWNGTDNAVPSSVQVDAIQFWGSGEFRLSISAPFGPGSIRLQNQGGDAGGSYWTAVTLQPGSFPHGWFFGLDISAVDLLNQVSGGAPFAGTLNGSGASTYTVPSGVPPGLQVYAVSIQFASAASGGEFVGASAPEHFVTL